jgi:hypothetical protein
MLLDACRHRASFPGTTAHWLRINSRGHILCAADFRALQARGARHSRPWARASTAEDAGRLARSAARPEAESYPEEAQGRTNAEAAQLALSLATNQGPDTDQLTGIHQSNPE